MVFKKLTTILIIFVIVTFAAPSKIRKRMVTLAKTPIVLPAKKSNRYSDRYYKKYKRLIHAAAREHEVPVSLIAAVIKAESNFRPYATSNKGAMGLMQITMETWVHLGGIGSPYNPAQNIMMGTKYLKELMEEFDNDIVLTLAAYNAGPGAVKKFQQVPPYNETRRYVPKVISYYLKYRNLLSLS